MQKRLNIFRAKNEAKEIKNTHKTKQNKFNLWTKLQNNIGIAQKLITSFIVLSIIPLFLTAGFSYINAEKTVEQKVGFYSEKMVQQIANNIDLKIKEIENIPRMVQYNSKLLEYIRKEEFNNLLEKINTESEIENILLSIENSNNSIKGINIYKENGEVFGSNFRIENSDGTSMSADYGKVFEELMKDSEEELVWVTGLNNSYDYIILLKSIKNFVNTKPIAVLAVYIKADEITSLFKEMDFSDTGSMFLLNPNKNIIGDINNENIGTQVTDGYLDKIYGENLFGNFRDADNVISYATTKNGWKVITKEPISSLMAEMVVVRKGILWIGAVCILVAVAIGILISLISKPLKMIMSLMGKVAGDLTVSLDIEGKNRLGEYLPVLIT